MSDPTTKEIKGVTFTKVDYVHGYERWTFNIGVIPYNATRKLGQLGSPFFVIPIYGKAKGRDFSSLDHIANFVVE